MGFGGQTFPTGINPKVNSIARLEFELAYYDVIGGAHGVMVIVEVSRHDDTSSNPGQGWLQFT